MLNKKQIDNLRSQMDNIKLLVQTYEEVAGIHMRKIRTNVLTNRTFIAELEEIYQQLKTSYSDQVIKILAKKKNNSTILSQKNGKAVTVLLSANTKLYGDIVQQTFDLFIDFVRKNETDIVIVGKLGQSLMDDSGVEKPYTYQELPDTDIDYKSLIDILPLLLAYEKIYLFYGKFQTIASQKPFMLDVYGQQEDIEKKNIAHMHYLFEPSLEKILQFFEQQIFATIIEQTFKESELAKFAARMVALDKATDNINSQMKKVNLQRRIVMHHLQNQKQQQALSGRKLWRLR